MVPSLNRKNYSTDEEEFGEELDTGKKTVEKTEKTVGC